MKTSVKIQEAIRKLIAKAKIYKKLKFSRRRQLSKKINEDKQEAYPDFTIIEDIDLYRNEFSSQDLFQYETFDYEEESYEEICNFSTFINSIQVANNQFSPHYNFDDDYEIIEYCA